jgi:rhamnogalacturonan endolyase
VTDELQKTDINVDDSRIDLGTIEWTPFCYEHKLFIIGQNNRMSDGFNLSDHPRAYGLWDKVPSTLTYTVGTSTPEKDWYFGQVRNGNWYVKFNNSETFTGKAHLTISAAGVSNSPKLNIMVNGKSLGTWTPSPNDASVYRSAVLGGRHHRYTAEFPASYLKTGVNTVTLAMSGIGKNGGILYDCLKLEAGERVLTAVNAPKKESEDKGTVLLFTTDGRLAGTFASLSEARVSARKGLYVYKQGQHSGKFVK